MQAHRERLVEQIEHILSDGIQQDTFEVTDLKAAARAIFDATVRYQHPAHAEEWTDPMCGARIDALLTLLLRGLEARVSAEHSYPAVCTREEPPPCVSLRAATHLISDIDRVRA